MQSRRRSVPVALVVLCALLAPIPLLAQGQTLRLRAVSVNDPMVNNIEAFRMLVPADWQVQGGVVWRIEMANLASVIMRVFAPNGSAMLETYPNIPFTWDQNGIFGFSPGSIYLGQIVHAPIWDAAAYVQQIILPQFRRGINARVVARQELADVAQQTATNVYEPGLNKRVLAERVRVEYEYGGQWYEEDFYPVLVFAQSPMMPTGVIWITDRMFSFRAVKGTIDAHAPLLHSIISSIRVNPTWFAQYMRVFEMWQRGQMEAIRSAGELSRYLARTSDEISAAYQQAWENQQRSQDRLSRQYSEYIRGVETYSDPYAGRDVQLPSGYTNYWVSANGEYLLSNQAGFNPNVGSTQNWQQMGRRQ